MQAEFSFFSTSGDRAAEEFDPTSMLTGPLSAFPSVFRSVPPPPADPALASLQLSGNDAEDRATIIAYFRKHLAQLPDDSPSLASLQALWSEDRSRADAVDSLFGDFSGIFAQHPDLFRLSGHPLRVSLAESRSDPSATQEDELLAVATSVTSRLFADSPAPERSALASTGDAPSTGPGDEKEELMAVLVGLLRDAPDQLRKRDDLSNELIKQNRPAFERMCEVWGSLSDALRMFPDLFVLQGGDGAGKEVVRLRTPDDETARIHSKRTIMEAVKTILKHNYGAMHPEDLRGELHRSKPIVMGRITEVYGGFAAMLQAEAAVLELIDDPSILTPPTVRLRWPAFCPLCAAWPETPEAWQAHIFSQHHTDMRRSVVRAKDGRDPDRWPVLRLVEERIRRAGGRLKMSALPNFGKNRPVFATYIRKLFGGFKQLVECDPRFRVLSEDGAADPTVMLLDDWRRDRLEGVVIRVKQKDTLIWIRPDTNPNIEFFLHRDRSVGGREIANSPAFVLPRVGDRMSFLPSNVPADPNPFAEAAVVLEAVPDYRVRFSGTIIHAQQERYLLRADFQTASGAFDSGDDLFEVVWRDDASRLAVNSGISKVTFIRSARPANRYPLADDVAVDAVAPPVPIHHYQQQQQAQPHYSRPSRAPVAVTSPSRVSQSTSMDNLHAEAAHVASSRRPTWPVVYYDPNATKTSPESSAPSSGDRTPLKVNLRKPIGEFAFRPRGASQVEGSGVPRPAAVPSAGMVAASTSVPIPGAGPSPRDTTRAIQLKLRVVNDESDLDRLLLPSVAALARQSAPNYASSLVSVVTDVGHVAVLRFTDGTCVRGTQPVTREEIQAVVDIAGNLGPEQSSVFGHSLHLVSTIRHPLTSDLTGLTVKVGRALIGLADVLSDFLDKRKSMLLVGDFGTGKTCLLRDIARRLSEDKSGRHVAVIDTTGELGGAADGVSHVGMGAARCVRCAKRKQVPDAVDHTVGRHAVGTLVTDGVCTVEGVAALLRARRQGVTVVASIGSPSLPAASCDEVFRPLFGKATAPVAGESLRGTPFDVAVEMTSLGNWIVHPFVTSSADAVLSGKLDSVAVARIHIQKDGSGTWTSSMYPNADELNFRY